MSIVGKNKKNKVLRATKKDIQSMLVCQVHQGSNKLESGMKKYIYCKTKDGSYVFNLAKTWEKLMLAARILAGVENSQDIMAISRNTYGRRAVLKFANYVKCKYNASKFIPGTFTNRIQNFFTECRVIIVCDPKQDVQAIREAMQTNVIVIAFCDTDTPLTGIDVAIPCNNKDRHSIALMIWLLAREILRIKGEIPRDKDWSVMVDLFFYREVDELKKMEKKKDSKGTEQQPETQDTEEDYNTEVNFTTSAQGKEWGGDEEETKGGQHEYPGEGEH